MTTTAVKERPILFSAEMVRAILDGRKTQTRRIVKPQPPEGWRPLAVEFYHPAFYGRDGMLSDGPQIFGAYDEEWGVKCQWEPGMRLWVRETWLPFRPDHVIDGKRYAYAADGTGDADAERCRIELDYKWRPSIHMPRAASRLTLEIESVRVERLHDISDEDKAAEGATADMPFGTVWRKINTTPGTRWEDNPWIWCIAFRRLP